MQLLELYVINNTCLHLRKSNGLMPDGLTMLPSCSITPMHTAPALCKNSIACIPTLPYPYKHKHSIVTDSLMKIF